MFKQAGAWRSLMPEELVPANPSVGLSEESEKSFNSKFDLPK